MCEICLLALGGNLPSQSGDPVQTLAAAVGDLNRGPVRLRKVSRFFSTPCFPPGAGPDYVNAAVEVETALAPRALLDCLHGIEAARGRARVQRWGMRTLDVDLIALGDRVIPTRERFMQWHDLPPDEQVSATPEELILPHPRIQGRAFVLVPLMDIARHWIHPVLGLSVRQMHDALPESDRAAVISL
ncbi:2-amino-4-hydroxy-6-hydroxymethyldihydropteridinediphosphokinase [Salinihabitans flavidus]|uniref:2-amino-4-hydroxy-6-hydroxymethyldihydropteridine pyrophosphokinase n=1 Tax=Salinihabitans flavidus TaxID=569882 RepID=A0A1H8L827_9RHOB|nr:2-amino-4-hydroxy-6-hydroxymethyldihydropteridine diphosphokinase [Salinihabitans flavidus]SEO01322.1 2-amino-4-hydroxy-6-hydroxymethyldihydropteridinediphosphokinase [Salinihabitans flavidus]